MRLSAPAGLTAFLARRRGVLIAAFYAVLFVACAAGVASALRDVGPAGVAGALATLSPWRILASALCVAGIYAVMAVLELFALEDVGVRPRAGMWGVGLIANAVATGTGFGALSGAGVRMRLYGRWGVRPAEAALAAVGVTLMSITGGVFVAAAGLAFAPEVLARALSAPPATLRALGSAVLAAFAAAFIVFALAPAKRGLIRRVLAAPHLPGLAGRVFVGGADWLVSAAALYVLLPGGSLEQFPVFAAIFVTAHLTAMLTGLPAGLGVFDVLMLGLNPAGAEPQAMAAALICYRVLSLAAPTALGALALGGLEARAAQRRYLPRGAVNAWAHRALHFLARRNGLSERSGARPRLGDLFERRSPRQRISLHALTGGGPILVVAPHPDDETLGCAGLLAAAAAAGHRPHVLVLTSGERSHPGSRLWSPLQIAKRRRREMTMAMRRLGLRETDVSFLDLPDGGLFFSRAQRAKAERAVAQWARRLKPKRVFVTWPDDPHPDHVAAATIAARACAANPGAQLAYYPIWGRFLPRGVRLSRRWRVAHLNISAVQRAKRAALFSHRTQMTPLISDARRAHRISFAQAQTFLTRSEIFLFPWGSGRNGRR